MTEKENSVPLLRKQTPTHMLYTIGSTMVGLFFLQINMLTYQYISNSSNYWAIIKSRMAPELYVVRTGIAYK